MKDKKKLPAVITILILTLITAVFWVFFSAYRSFTDETEPVVPKEVLLPLNPKLDTDTIDKIKERKHFDTIEESFIQNPEVLPSPVATQETTIASPAPIATQEAELGTGL